jgi:hypothetical protein
LLGDWLSGDWLAGREEFDVIGRARPRPPNELHDLFGRRAALQRRQLTKPPPDPIREQLGAEYFEDPEPPRDDDHPRDEKLVSIRQVANLTGRKTRTVRAWDDMGKVPKSTRGKGGIRYWTPEQVEVIVATWPPPKIGVKRTYVRRG